MLSVSFLSEGARGAIGAPMICVLLAMAAQSCRLTFPAALLFEQLKINIFSESDQKLLQLFFS